MTMNIARANPIYFSNNILESVRARFHADKFYNSFSLGVVQTEEGIDCVDELVNWITKQPKIKGL